MRPDHYEGCNCPPEQDKCRDVRAYVKAVREANQVRRKKVPNDPVAMVSDVLAGICENLLENLVAVAALAGPCRNCKNPTKPHRDIDCWSTKMKTDESIRERAIWDELIPPLWVAPTPDPAPQRSGEEDFSWFKGEIDKDLLHKVIREQHARNKREADEQNRDKETKR